MTSSTFGLYHRQLSRVGGVLTSRAAIDVQACDIYDIALVTLGRTYHIRPSDPKLGLVNTLIDMVFIVSDMLYNASTRAMHWVLRICALLCFEV